MPPPRSMTPAEKAQYGALFPNLNTHQAVVTDNATSRYNCIAWTVGITNRWIWPGGTIGAFDTFYNGLGFVRAQNGPIAVWGTSLAAMTHGCVSGSGHGPRWESKCGAGLRIQHALAELVGSVYGRVVAFYRQTGSAGGKHAARARLGGKARTMRFRLTSEQRRRLDEQRREIPPEVREAFATAFRAWKEAWRRGSLVINSDPRSRAVGPEFDALVALGPRILPLIVDALTDADNFFALQLYDAIQPNGQLVVQYGPDDERILEGEQGRAWRTVQAWFANQ